MLEKRKMLMDAGTDRCIQLANGFLILAEKELSAFIRAVDKLFGAEQARQSALDWIEELGRMDWPSGESIPESTHFAADQASVSVALCRVKARQKSWSNKGPRTVSEGR
jgi:hypothetical protein